MSRKAERRSRGSVVLSLGIGLLVVVLFLLGGLSVVYFSDFTLPGVQALGVDLGGKTTVEATNALLDRWQGQTITVSGGGKTWSLAPSRLGLVLDADATVRVAHQLGRSPATLAGLWQRNGTVTPVWRFDRDAAEATLRVLAAEVQVPPQDAHVSVTNGQVTQAPGVAGQALDIAATAAWLSTHAEQTLNDRKLELVVQPVAPAVNDLGPAIQQAQQMLAGPRTLSLYDPIRDESLTWEVQPQEISNWLALHLNPEDSAWGEWTVDQAKVRSYLDTQQASLGPDRYIEIDKATPALIKAVTAGGPALDLRIYHRQQEHVVAAGETYSTIAQKYGMPYPWLQQANPGTGEMLRVGQKIVIPSPDVFVPLAPVKNKRIIVSIPKQRVQVFENGQLKWDWKASTGMASSPTSPGVFQIRTHDVKAYAANWDLWMPNFMGIYQPVPDNDFMNGFHGFPSRGGSQILWQNNLGAPVTYGCVLVSSENAKLLYDWAEEGVVVEITS